MLAVSSPHSPSLFFFFYKIASFIKGGVNSQIIGCINVTEVCTVL